MDKSLNFRSLENQSTYIKTYEESLQLIKIPLSTIYVTTSFGTSHVIACGEEDNPSLVLLHAASCGSTIFYKNLAALSEHFRVYAIDLIGESSMSILTRKIKKTSNYALWLDETLTGLKLKSVILGGLSIGGWTALNYAGFYPQRVSKLILMSPVQSFAQMYPTFFIKIMKMGFHPTKENIESYIGWGSERETADATLPNSILELFRLSVTNMSGNVVFPKWIKKKHLAKITMPTLLLFGEHEFAFSVSKAQKRAQKLIKNLNMEVIKDASHLLPVSKPVLINQKIINFINE